MKKIIWPVVVIAIIILAVSLNKPTETNNTIKIGGLFGQTGFVSFAGESSRNGFIMAIEDSGLDVDYVLEDTQSDISKTVTATRKLINVDGVDVIIGPEWAEWGEVAAPIGNTANVPVISPWMASEFEWSKLPYYFSATASERFQVKEVLDYMVKSGHKKVALYSNVSSWSDNLAAVVKQEVKDNYKDLSIVFESKTNEGISDYRTELLKLKNSDADVIYAVISGGSKPEVFARQTKELGINLPIFMPVGSIQSLLSNQAGASIGDGIYYPADKVYVKTSEFNDKYLKRFGTLPSAISAATSYDMTMLVIDAIKSGAKNGEDIKNYLNSVDNYVGYSNVIKFNEYGQQSFQDTELRQIRGGSYVMVE